MSRDSRPGLPTAFDLHQGRGRLGCHSGSIRTDGQRVESVVAGLPLFRGLPRARCIALARAARLVAAHRGDAVVRRGEAVAGVYAVIEGLLKVALRGAGGAERVLRFVAPGETFGEAAVLAGRASPVEVVALADSVLIVIAAQPLRSLVAHDAELSRRMTAALAERMLALLAEIEASELRPAGERLVSYLLALARPADGGALVAHLPATKTLVASRLGMKKETLSRLLAGLAGRHLIGVSRRDIAILDAGALRAMARG